MKPINTHKTITLRSASVLIGDDNGLKDLTELLKVSAHSLALSLPRQSSHKHLGVRSISKRGIQELKPGTRTGPRTRTRNRLIRHEFPTKRNKNTTQKKEPDSNPKKAEKKDEEDSAKRRTRLDYDNDQVMLQSMQ